MDPIYVTTSSEYFAYDWESAAGDFGGMVGMLLGASCLALFDSLIRMTKKIRKFCTMTC